MKLLFIIRYVKSNIACICNGYLQWLLAAGICHSYLPWEFTAAICRGFLPWEFEWLFAVILFCVCKQTFFLCEQILFLSKKIFFNWKLTFFICEQNLLFMNISLLTVFPIVTAVAVMGHRKRKVASFSNSARFAAKFDLIFILTQEKALS